MECAVDSDCTGNNEVCRMSYDNVLRCQCVSGYTGATCVDIDECDCMAEFAECINVCENEECQMMKCAGNNEVCANTDGSFTCDCANGFVRNDRNFCVDIDECEEGMCSGNRQICTNTIGSFQCVCEPGYELQNLVCIESCLGRCNVDTEDCLQSDLSCVCKNGYFGSSGNCQDIDECGDSATCTSLGSNMVCSNTPGSFVCQCAAGFQLVGDQCVDINECDEGTHNCGSSPNCINTDGSFMCSCTEDERLVNGNCVALRSFRVKIVATELNNTIPGDPLTSRTLFTDHFCRVILDNLERRLPGIPEDCSDISFVGRVTGYLRVRMASASLAASDIESLLEANVVMDITGDLRIRSDDTQTTITIVDPGSDIDVADFTTDPCNPSPCQNNAPCIQDSALIESNCLCRQGFFGDFCEFGAGVVDPTQQPPITPTTAETNRRALIIVIIVAIVVILLITLVCCLFACCYFLSNRPNTFGAPGPGPGFGGPSLAGPGVAPIRGPPSVSGFGRGGYYEANSVI